MGDVRESDLSVTSDGSTSENSRRMRSQAMRVEFLNFSAGTGNVWLHDGDQVAGPYTGRGIYDDRHFWSAAIFSDIIICARESRSAISADKFTFWRK